MINRDGNNESLWQHSTNDFPTRNKAISNQLYDVAIIGAGITGITTAVQLQQAGKECIVLEANSICFGTTGGTTAHLNTLLDTPYTTIAKNFGSDSAKLVAAAARKAIDLVKDNIAAFDIDCGFKETPAFLFSQVQEQTKELQEILEASAQAGLQVSYTNHLPISIPFEKVMKVERQARFNPVQYVMALAEAFEKMGGTIVQQCRVMDTTGDDILSIETSKGKFQAKVIVFATHIPIGVNLLHFRCQPYRSYAMAVQLEDGNYPEGLVYDMYDPYHYYRTQEVGGQPYLIVGGEDHRTGTEENTNMHFRKLEAHIREYFAVKEISYKWSSQYYEPADGLPYIGHLPGHPNNMLVASGYGGNGMVYSQVAAQLLTDMVLGNETAYQKLFDPNRIKPVAGFVNFIKNNVEVTKELLRKIIPAEKLKELSGLALEEGHVVNYEHHKVALYKDAQGNVHAVNPACTHINCNVAWNSSEQSWDCPCHGARFNCDGEVLNGPATENLEKIPLTSEE
jgi:glycine/D-amino acid oxidase-like deaminating enzyme/nitrite reductase/ring-hydroxylating ferredoxin subunit